MIPIQLPHHKFAKELQFSFDLSSKLYSIETTGIFYTMPYVVTLRMNRYFKHNSSPTADQFKEWYNNLPEKEKSLVKPSIVR